FRTVDRSVQPDVDKPVALIVRMKGDSNREAVDLDQKFRLTRSLIVSHRQQSPRTGPDTEVLEHEQPVRSRLRRHAQRLLDRQIGERPRNLVRQDRLRRTDDARVVPWYAPFESESLLRLRTVVGAHCSGTE